MFLYYLFFFFFKQKTAYEMRISDWSSDVCSSDLRYAQTRIIAERQDRRVAQASDVAPTRLEQHRQREPPDGFPPDPFAEPQRAGLALPDSGPTPQPTQRIADHDGTDGAWNVEKVMGHRQRGQAPGNGRRLGPP